MTFLKKLFLTRNPTSHWFQRHSRQTDIGYCWIKTDGCRRLQTNDCKIVMQICRIKFGMDENWCSVDFNIGKWLDFVVCIPITKTNFKRKSEKWNLCWIKYLVTLVKNSRYVSNFVRNRDNMQVIDQSACSKIKVVQSKQRSLPWKSSIFRLWSAFERKRWVCYRWIGKTALEKWWTTKFETSSTGNLRGHHWVNKNFVLKSLTTKFNHKLGLSPEETGAIVSLLAPVMGLGDAPLFEIMLESIQEVNSLE